jgi:hypothetical protein
MILISKDKRLVKDVTLSLKKIYFFKLLKISISRI